MRFREFELGHYVAQTYSNGSISIRRGSRDILKSLTPEDAAAIGAALLRAASYSVISSSQNVATVLEVLPETDEILKEAHKEIKERVSRFADTASELTNGK